MGKTIHSAVEIRESGSWQALHPEDVRAWLHEREPTTRSIPIDGYAYVRIPPDFLIIHKLFSGGLAHLYGSGWDSPIVEARGLPSDLSETLRDPPPGNPDPRCTGSLDHSWITLRELEAVSWADFREGHGRGWWVEDIGRRLTGFLGLFGSPDDVRLVVWLME